MTLLVDFPITHLHIYMCENDLSSSSVETKCLSIFWHTPLEKRILDIIINANPKLRFIYKRVTNLIVNNTRMQDIHENRICRIWIGAVTFLKMHISHIVYWLMDLNEKLTWRIYINSTLPVLNCSTKNKLAHNQFSLILCFTSSV